MKSVKIPSKRLFQDVFTQSGRLLFATMCLMTVFKNVQNLGTLAFTVKYRKKRENLETKFTFNFRPVNALDF